MEKVGVSFSAWGIVSGTDPSLVSHSEASNWAFEGTIPPDYCRLEPAKATRDADVVILLVPMGDQLEIGLVNTGYLPHPRDL